MGELLRAGGKFSHRWFGETGRLFLWIFYKWSLKALISYCVCAACLVGQSCLTLCDSVDYSPPGFSVHEILQARILEWAAIPFSRGSSPPRDWTGIYCIAGRFFIIWATREAQYHMLQSNSILICSLWDFSCSCWINKLAVIIIN